MHISKKNLEFRIAKRLPPRKSSLYIIFIIHHHFCLSDLPLVHFHPFVAFDIQTPQNPWIEAINITNYLTHCFPTQANFGITPYQQLK
jgi:hypothetical protein